MPEVQRHIISLALSVAAALIAWQGWPSLMAWLLAFLLGCLAIIVAPEP